MFGTRNAYQLVPQRTVRRAAHGKKPRALTLRHQYHPATNTLKCGILHPSSLDILQHLLKCLSIRLFRRTMHLTLTRDSLVRHASIYS